LGSARETENKARLGLPETMQQRPEAAAALSASSQL